MNVKKELFSPIKSKRTFEEVSGKIKTLIFDGVLKPGDRLPSEIELARQFMVSRQTIREALRILELSGFIKVQKGGSGGPLIKDTIRAKPPGNRLQEKRHTAKMTETNTPAYKILNCPAKNTI